MGHQNFHGVPYKPICVHRTIGLEIELDDVVRPRGGAVPAGGHDQDVVGEHLGYGPHGLGHVNPGPEEQGHHEH